MRKRKQQFINQFFHSLNERTVSVNTNQAEVDSKESNVQPLLSVDDGHGQKRQQSEQTVEMESSSQFSSAVALQERKRIKVAVAECFDEEVGQTPPQEQKTVTDHNGVGSTIQGHTTKLREQNVRRPSQMMEGKLHGHGCDAQLIREFPDICEKPNQLDSNFKFLIRQCGSKKRSFQHS